MLKSIYHFDINPVFIFLDTLRILAINAYIPFSSRNASHWFTKPELCRWATLAKTSDNKNLCWAKYAIGLLQIFLNYSWDIGRIKGKKCEIDLILECSYPKIYRHNCLHDKRYEIPQSLPALLSIKNGYKERSPYDKRIRHCALSEIRFSPPDRAVSRWSCISVPGRLVLRVLCRLPSRIWPALRYSPWHGR